MDFIYFQMYLCYAQSVNKSLSILGRKMLYIETVYDLHRFWTSMSAIFGRGAGSNLGRGGGGSISKRGTLFYFGKQAEKPKSLLNLYD